MILSNPVGWVRDGDTDNNIKDRMNEGIEDILSRWLATVVCTSGYGARFHSYRALAGSKSECSAAPDTYEHIASPAFGQGGYVEAWCYGYGRRLAPNARHQSARLWWGRRNENGSCAWIRSGTYGSELRWCAAQRMSGRRNRCVPLFARPSADIATHHW